MKYKLEIVYSDSDIIVVNKPGGLLSVPGKGPKKQDCISKRLQNIFTEMITQPAVHRLDMYTSGLMVFAINRMTHRHLSMQFERREVNKKYQALLDGILIDQGGEITLPFRLDPENRPLQVYDPVQGKSAMTLWANQGIESSNTRVEFTPLTGRTHQLRVHAAHTLGLNAPIVGDSIYGSGSDGDQMMLHATFLQFEHPCTGELINFTSEPPF